MRFAPLLALLVGCTASVPVPPSAPPAYAMELCPPKVIAPRAPAETASRKVIAAWSIKLQLAREEGERRRADCADRHAALVEWVTAHLTPASK